MTRNYSAQESERGTTLIEFALVVIILFILIFGIIDFGRAAFAYHFVANAAREGTRYASVRGSSCSVLMTNCPATSSDVNNLLSAQATGSGLDPNQFSAVASWPVNGDSPSVCTTSAVNSPGCTVQVSVSYTFKFIFPLLPTIPLNMSSTSAMVITQ